MDGQLGRAVGPHPQRLLRRPSPGVGTGPGPSSGLPPPPTPRRRHSPLRLTVRLFCEHLVRSRERALRAGTHPRADSTIEGTLGIVRDLAIFLADERAKTDWATVQAGDIEAFLNTRRSNRGCRLTALRQFFVWARRTRTVLVDPTADITLTPRRGFTGDTLTVAEQRRLFRRWTTSDNVHPHEAAVAL